MFDQESRLEVPAENAQTQVSSDQLAAAPLPTAASTFSASSPARWAYRSASQTPIIPVAIKIWLTILAC